MKLLRNLRLGAAVMQLRLENWQLRTRSAALSKENQILWSRIRARMWRKLMRVIGRPDRARIRFRPLESLRMSVQLQARNREIGRWN